MNTLDMLYVRTASGLMVPRSAVAPPPVQPISEAEKKAYIASLPRQQRRRIEHLERKAGSPGRTRKGGR